MMRAVLIGFALASMLSQTGQSADPLSVERTDGVTVPAYLTGPRATGTPLVVMLHGCSGLIRRGAVSPIYVEWSRYLSEAGFASLQLDSAGARGFSATCGAGPSRKTMWRERPGDAYAALAWARAQAWVGEVFLAGWSQGGGVALLTLSNISVGRPSPPPERDFDGAVALYPGACAERWQTRPFTNVDPNAWTPVAPLLVLHGAADDWTPEAPCRDFIEAAASRGADVGFVSFPDARHGFDAPGSGLRRLLSATTSDGEHPLVGPHPQSRAKARKAVVDFFRELMARDAE